MSERSTDDSDNRGDLMPKLQYDLVVYMKRAINNDVSKSGSHSRPNDELCAGRDDP